MRGVGESGKNSSKILPKNFFNLPGRRFPHIIGVMDVGIHDSFHFVPQESGYGLYIHTVGNQRRGECVAQGVESHVGKGRYGYSQPFAVMRDEYLPYTGWKRTDCFYQLRGNRNCSDA